MTKGVSERLEELSGPKKSRVPRPPYIHQIPLQFIPGVGPKTLDKLKRAFGTEMAILHQAQEEELARVVQPKIAAVIHKARTGQLVDELPGARFMNDSRYFRLDDTRQFLFLRLMKNRHLRPESPLQFV